MRRGILIALLVPAVALAGPKKKKKKAAPPPVEDKEPAAEEAVAPPTPDAPGTPTVPPSFKPGSTSAPPATTTTKTGSAPPQQGAPTQPTPSTPPTGAAPTPVSAQPPKDEEPPAKDGKEIDVDALRQEYLSLRDELFKSRARANAVAGQLYSTRMSIKFTWDSARHYGVSKASIRVDGATVYEDSTGAIANDDGVRFNGYVAPGRHLVTFHVEAAGKDDDSFTSATESQVVVKAVANKDLIIVAKGHDTGDIAYEWKRSEKGSYGLGIDVSVKSMVAGAKK
jgi:hypothetical protein